MSITHAKVAEGDDLKVKINEDCKSAILSNGTKEHYYHDGKNQVSI
jgi:hypothetical protein